jgi:hypothetical protein
MEPNPAELRGKFLAMGMPGVAALIDMLENHKRKGRELTEIGSSSIGNQLRASMGSIYDRARARFPEKPFSFFYIGVSPRRVGTGQGMTIYEHLDLLYQVLETVSQQVRADFDAFCAEFVRSGRRVDLLKVDGVDPAADPFEQRPGAQ